MLPSFSRTRRVFHHLSVLLSASVWLSACKAVNKAVSFHLISLVCWLPIYLFILISFLSPAVHYNLKKPETFLSCFGWSLSFFPLSISFSDVSLITLTLSDFHWQLSPSSYQLYIIHIFWQPGTLIPCEQPLSTYYRHFSKQTFWLVKARKAKV